MARARGAYPGLPLPPKSLAEVRTVGYWDADHNQSWGLDWHRNEGIELTYVSHGKVHFAVGEQHYLLKRGDLTITRPWQIHRVGNPNVSACRLHWLILDVGVRRPNQAWHWPRWLASSDADISSLTEMLSQNEQPVWEADDEVGYYFEKLGEAVADYEGSKGESYLRLYISGLIVAVTGLLQQRRPVLDSSLTSAHRTVEVFLSSLRHDLDHNWDLDTMASACGLGRSQFAHYCKQITNMSPGEYLSSCRVEAASKLLVSQSKLSITDVGLGCGFGSSQYFATVFRERMGCSPREYRRQAVSGQFQDP
ncbi:MAG: AraC family transcriptional regulator [Chloroflexota bacterium]|nr:AraC family transcriptional regulator [Chloroflexota bacterium]